MARLLVATIPLSGHVYPMVELVRELAARGHDVTWTGAGKFAPAIVAAGARFAPMRAAHDWDDARVEDELPALRGTRGIRRAKMQVREMFIAPMRGQLADLEELAAAGRPDAVIGDVAHLGAGLFAEKHDVPWISMGVSVLMLPSRDTAPFGSALPPGRVGPRVRSFLNWLIHRVVFRDVNRAYQAEREAAGLPRTEQTYFDVIATELYLHPAVPGFEFPRSDLPPQVRFIGPLSGRMAPGSTDMPIWWRDVTEARRQGKRVVFLTQGTLATDPHELIAPAVRALAAEDVMVVVAGRTDELGALPANVRATRFVPYQLVLPHVDVMVTNGGYGGVTQALMHGVPLVVAGATEDKPEVAARVAWCGAGIDLRTARPRARAVGAAVRRVLDEPAFRERARALAAEIEAHDAPVLAADLVEQIVGTSVRARAAHA